MKLISLMKLLRVNREDIFAVLKSRALFRNWYIIPLLYIFCKALKRDLLECKVRVMCRKGGNATIALEIWGQVIRGYYYGFIQSITCSENFIIADDLRINVYKSQEIVDMGIAKFKKLRHPILYTFITNIYGLLNVRNKIVIDVGAYIGDSAIYFALRGAKRVIAIEPHPEAFREITENIRLSNLEGIIIPVNAGLASRPGEICIKNVDVKKTAVIYHKPGGRGTLVPAITLADVIEGYAINHSAILKMDCEGCEYDVILNDYEHISIFKELLFEYHAYVIGIPVLKLLKKLAKDYDCNVIKRGKGFGLIHCLKRS